MDRKVTAAKRDRTGRIVALCNPAEQWSPRRSADIVKDIQLNRKSYYVEAAARRRRYVRVVSGGLLQTTADTTSENSLDRLPGA